MKRRTLLQLALPAMAFAAPRIEVDTPVLVSADPATHYGFPRLVRAANKDLLLFYRVGHSHASDHSSIAMKVSRDDGRTWSAERILFKDPDPGRSAHNPVALVMPDGRIVLWISRLKYSPAPAVRATGAWSWSDDHGKTWSPFRTFDDDFTRSSYYMTDAILTASGALAANASFPPSGIGNCYVVFWQSKDRGRTWHTLSQLTKPEDNRGDEVALLELAPNRILCLLRTRRQPGAKSYPPGLSSFESNDGGKTWKEGENLLGQLGLTLQRPFLTRIDSRNVLLTGRDIERKEIVAFLSTDNAKTFGSKVVVEVYERDGAYTACVLARNKDILMVYYADSPNTLPDIKSVRMRIR